MAKEYPNILVYRIVHIDNLVQILKHGMFIKGHNSNHTKYLNIGNSEIINTRKEFPVKIKGYGFIGDYVPFYFGRQSIMLYNILTGQNGVQKQSPDNIIYICCYINELVKNCSQYFFTDGQANKKFTQHLITPDDLEKVDWKIVNGSDFKKTEADPDKARKYQAEFLIHKYVPVKCIHEIIVYNENKKAAVELLIAEHALDITVRVEKKEFYFYF